MFAIVIDYDATGEGRHIWQGLVLAVTKEDAIKKFREAFPKDFTKDDSWDYYSLGMDVKEIKEGLDGTEFLFFKETVIDFFNETINCGPEFFFSFHVNCS